MSHPNPQYKEDQDPALLDEPVLHLEVLVTDVICSKCGIWRTEHDWDKCTTPNWLDSDD